MEKPTDLILWASSDWTGEKYGQPNKVEPTEEKIALGFVEDEIPSRNHFNWLLNNIYQWIALLDEIFEFGDGTPEGVVTADIGTLYIDTTSSSGSTLYVKESGTGNTGWVAK